MRRPRRPRLPIPALAHRHRPRARTLAALALILVAAAPNHATAQTAIQTGAVEATNTQVFPFLGARFGTPQRLSVSAGIGLNLDPGADPTQPSGELLLALAPGLGAERASADLCPFHRPSRRGHRRRRLGPAHRSPPMAGAAQCYLRRRRRRVVFRSSPWAPASDSSGA